MALKSTIYKVELSIADMDRQHYETYPLTLARHPSENEQRMMVRILAFARHAGPVLTFAKALVTTVSLTCGRSMTRAPSTPGSSWAR